MQLPKIDEKATVNNAKKKLNEYHRWREYAKDSAKQRITANYSLEPRTKTNKVNKAVEDLALNRVMAMQEVEAIEEAVNGILNPMYRRILIERFFKLSPLPNWQLAQELGYGSTAFQDRTREALVAFAQRYRDGELVEEV